MKISLFFLLFITLQAFSQEYQYVPFPKTGAFWSERFYSHDEFDDEKTMNECFAVNGEDTIINDHTYTKVYYFQDSVFDKSTAYCIGGIREDSLKQVYYIGEQIHQLKPQLQYQESGVEIMLFDFGIEVGDTIMEINSDAPREANLFVSRIDTIELGGVLRKQFFFKWYDDSHWGFSWIEGVGSTRGLLFVSGVIPYSFNNRLRCFFQDGELVYHNSEYDECFGDFVGVEDLELQKGNVIVQPNPVVNDLVVFNFRGCLIKFISIYNNSGSLVDSYAVNNSESVSLNFSQQNSGVYYYKAFTLAGEFVSGKFILR
jgi:hypothetical protein